MKNIKLIIAMKCLREMAFSSAIFNLYFVSIGFSVGELAIYFTVSRLSQTLFEVPTGMFADKFGRAWAIQLSRVAVIISFIFMIIAGSFWLVLLAAALNGLCDALYDNADTSIVYDELKQSDKIASYPRFVAAYNGLGFVAYGIAAVVGTMIASHSMVTTFIIQIPIFLVHLVLAGYVKEGKNITKRSTVSITIIKESWSKIIRNRHIMRIIYFSAIVYAFNLIAWRYYQSYGMEIGLPIIMFGWMAVMFSAAEGLPQFISYRFIDPKHFAKLYLILIATAAALGVGSAILHNGTGFALLVLSVMVTGLSFPISSAIIQKHAGNKYRATVSSFGTLFCMLAYVVINLIFGAVAEIENIFVALGAVSAVTFGAAVFYLFVHAFRPKFSKYHIIFSDVINPLVNSDETEDGIPHRGLHGHIHKGKWSHR